MLLTSERRFECYFFFFFKQKTAYEMRISDWSSDVYPSDLGHQLVLAQAGLNGLEDAGMHALDDARRRFHVGELLRRLHRALPVHQVGGIVEGGVGQALLQHGEGLGAEVVVVHLDADAPLAPAALLDDARQDRKSTRLNSSH